MQLQEAAKAAKAMPQTAPDGAIPDFKIDTSSVEGQFIDGVMSKAKTALKDVDPSNPMQAMMGIYQSGIMTDMMASFKGAASGGKKLNLRKMFSVMQTAMDSVLPPDEEEETPPQTVGPIGPPGRAPYDVKTEISLTLPVGEIKYRPTDIVRDEVD